MESCFVELLLIPYHIFLGQFNPRVISRDMGELICVLSII